MAIETTGNRISSWQRTATAAKVTSAEGLPPGPRMPRALQSVLIWTQRQWFVPAMHRRYGDTFTINAEPTGYGVVLRDPADLRTIFRGDPDVFHAGEGNALLAPIVGRRSVLTMDAPEHVVERRRMLPPFHGERIAQAIELMVEETEREVARWPVDRDFELLPRMQELTLNIIVRVVLGVDEDDRAQAVGAALRRVLTIRLRNMLLWLWPGLQRLRPWTKVVRDMDRADELLYAEIERRRADPGRAGRPDVLSMLLDGDPDPELVRDELVTLLVAGHETTAVALSWTFERLLRHPGALAKVRAGLDDPRDPYRAAVAKEALRLRPVILNNARRLTRPVELAGCVMPAGTLLIPSIIGIHTDPKIWGPNAAEFRPERWLADDPPTYAWIPFGGGARRCLGATFALTEIDAVLRTVLRRIDLRADRPRDESRRMHHITLVPSRGARVRVAAG
ncbi:cytochrome P450 [Mycobacterium sp. IS-1556]|uniref:cytochrome P450 n=1 Tax=Mycobacterium sp. IS-1556 TaxID=1772276 RepID=UPI0009E92554|nr:cytochrome P450 [Mycobacterium sp. IS-1556]